METIVKLPGLERYDFGGFFGCTQEWYETEWQRMAGCGPTTAANVFYYAAIEDPNCAPLYTAAPSMERADLLRLMNASWDCVTPTRMGLHSTQLFVEGAERYAADRGVDLTCRALNVGEERGDELMAEFIEFIRAGLSAGLPVAFLNLSAGELENLHDWHWVNLFSLEREGDDFFSLASDEGERKTLNMSRWFKTARMKWDMQTEFYGGLVVCGR